MTSRCRRKENRQNNFEQYKFAHHLQDFVFLTSNKFLIATRKTVENKYLLSSHRNEIKSTQTLCRRLKLNPKIYLIDKKKKTFESWKDFCEFVLYCKLSGLNLWESLQ